MTYAITHDSSKINLLQKLTSTRCSAKFTRGSYNFTSRYLITNSSIYRLKENMPTRQRSIYLMFPKKLLYKVLVFWQTAATKDSTAKISLFRNITLWPMALYLKFKLYCDRGWPEKKSWECVEDLRISLELMQTVLQMREKKSVEKWGRGYYRSIVRSNKMEREKNERVIFTSAHHQKNDQRIRVI